MYRACLKPFSISRRSALRISRAAGHVRSVTTFQRNPARPVSAFGDNAPRPRSYTKPQLAAAPQVDEYAAVLSSIKQHSPSEFPLIITALSRLRNGSTLSEVQAEMAATYPKLRNRPLDNAFLLNATRLLADESGLSQLQNDVSNLFSMERKLLLNSIAQSLTAEQTVKFATALSVGVEEYHSTLAISPRESVKALNRFVAECKSIFANPEASDIDQTVMSAEPSSKDIAQWIDSLKDHFYFLSLSEFLEARSSAMSGQELSFYSQLISAGHLGRNARKFLLDSVEKIFENVKELVRLSANSEPIALQSFLTAPIGLSSISGAHSLASEIQTVLTDVREHSHLGYAVAEFVFLSEVFNRRQEKGLPKGFDQFGLTRKVRHFDISHTLKLVQGLVKEHDAGAGPVHLHSKPAEPLLSLRALSANVPEPQLTSIKLFVDQLCRHLNLTELESFLRQLTEYCDHTMGHFSPKLSPAPSPPSPPPIDGSASTEDAVYHLAPDMDGAAASSLLVDREHLDSMKKAFLHSMCFEWARKVDSVYARQWGIQLLDILESPPKQLPDLMLRLMSDRPVFGSTLYVGAFANVDSTPLTHPPNLLIDNEFADHYVPAAEDMEDLFLRNIHSTANPAIAASDGPLPDTPAASSATQARQRVSNDTVFRTSSLRVAWNSTMAGPLTSAVSRMSSRPQQESEYGPAFHKVFVTNLAADVTIEQLQVAFASCGTLSGVEIFRGALAGKPLHKIHHFTTSPVSNLLARSEFGFPPRSVLSSRKFVGSDKRAELSPVTAFVYFQYPEGQQKALSQALQVFGIDVNGRACFTAPVEKVYTIAIQSLSGDRLPFLMPADSRKSQKLQTALKARLSPHLGTHLRNIIDIGIGRGAATIELRFEDHHSAALAFHGLHKDLAENTVSSFGPVSVTWHKESYGFTMDSFDAVPRPEARQRTVKSSFTKNSSSSAAPAQSETDKLTDSSALTNLLQHKNNLSGNAEAAAPAAPGSAAALLQKLLQVRNMTSSEAKDQGASASTDAAPASPDGSADAERWKVLLAPKLPFSLGVAGGALQKSSKKPGIIFDELFPPSK